MVVLSAITFIVANRNWEMNHPNLQAQESTECAGIRAAVTQYNGGSLDWSRFDDALAVAKAESEATYVEFPQPPFVAQLVGDIERVHQGLVASQAADPSPLLTDCGMLSPNG